MVQKKVMHECIQEVPIATMAEKLSQIEHKVDKIDQKLEELPDKLKETFASKERFELVERIVFGAAGFILLTVLAAVIYLVVRNGGN
jgi:hypothetical protein